MSTHQVEVVPVVLEKHPNADTLSVVRVRGFTVCVRTADWKDGDIGAYIEPDSVVDSKRPEFAFLDGHERIKVKKLRGIVSQGLLVPAPAGAKVGDNVMEALGVTHYDPPEPMSTGGECAKPPKLYAPYYDVENWRRYRHLLNAGEPVTITEKLHGANGRFTFHDGRMWCGSHGQWKRQDDKNLWWQALDQNPWVEAFCREHPGMIVYAEVFGQVQDLKYGAAKGQYFVRAFDLLERDVWLSPASFPDALPVPTVYVGVYDEALVEKLSSGPSLIAGANHLREGIVIQPEVERTDPEIGRVKLKLVSNTYLERA